MSLLALAVAAAFAVGGTAEDESPPAASLERVKRRVEAIEQAKREGRQALTLIGERGVPAPAGAVARFETTVDVVAKSPSTMFSRYLEGFDTRIGPATGAPTAAELQPYGFSGGFSLNLLPLIGSFLGGKMPSGPFYVYEVTSAKGSYPLVRQTEMKAERLPLGVQFRFVGSFADWPSARKAYEALDSRKAP